MSALLHGKIELVSQPLLDASRRFLTHPRIEALYPEYLIALHCVVRSSVPVMRTALDRAEGMADSDPVADGLIAYLEGLIHFPRDGATFTTQLNLTELYHEITTYYIAEPVAQNFPESYLA